MRPIFAALIAMPLLAGCAAAPPVDRQAAANQLVGQPEAEVVRQMGVPTRSFDTDGHRFMAYLEHRVEVTPGRGPWAPFWGWWGGGSYGPDVSPAVQDFNCETTFEISGGRVQSFSFRGNACGVS